ncbi:hypothetical protein GYMLUDRAFT_1009133 [Collybiopsis luxurians FD-317 M1]|nr:hypothetical protein GYMLUDRAFT_1009133 [Collybiopsis luxurians FD-317 M1]
MRGTLSSPKPLEESEKSAILETIANDSRQRCQETYQLFTPFSNFYSRKLPPLGIRACNLNTRYEMNFVIGEIVLVRKFDVQNLQWSEWTSGTVIKISVVRGYVGSYAKMYTVKSKISNSTGTSIEAEYLPFLYEIWPISCSPPPPSISPQDYFKQREKTKYVYALVDRIWVPSMILDWKTKGDYYDSLQFTVQCKAGPNAGSLFLVHEILPYTLESSVACRHQGDFVMHYNGALMAPEGKKLSP